MPGLHQSPPDQLFALLQDRLPAPLLGLFRDARIQHRHPGRPVLFPEVHGVLGFDVRLAVHMYD